MNSPITGKKMSIKIEVREMTFRKELFKINFHFFLCEDTGEQFTSSDLDQINVTQLYNQYREKYNIPFPDEIIKIREKYDLPANKMSEILGFGINGYRNYENGEIPNISNSKLIQLAKDPKQFKVLVEISESLNEKDKNKLLTKLNQLIELENSNTSNSDIEEYIFNSEFPSEYNGYKRPSLNKITEMVVYFTERMQPWKTQLNKLLFYCDFLSYKLSCYSISGLQYRAIQMGPVPVNYQSMFELIVNNDDVDVESTEFPTGAIGEKFCAHPKRTFNKDVFNEFELSILEKVYLKFKDKSTADIIEISHKEKAWLEFEKDKSIISYNAGFELSQMDGVFD